MNQPRQFIESLKKNSPSIFILFMLSLPFASAGSLGTGQGFVLFGLLISILICSLFFFGIAIVTTNSPMKFFFIVLGAVCIIFNIGISINIIQAYFPNFTGLSSIFNNFYYLIITLISAGIIAGTIGAFIWAIASFKNKRYGMEE